MPKLKIKTGSSTWENLGMSAVAGEWSAATVDQSEAEAGAATTRRAWTAERVAQAIAAQVAAWWTLRLATAQTWTAAQRGAIVPLTDAATVAVDFALGNFAAVTLAGNRTLGNPTNQAAGQSGAIFITQDATGSRTLAYSSNWKFPSGTAPSLSTAANAVDRLDYVVQSSGFIHANLTKDIK